MVLREVFDQVLDLHFEGVLGGLGKDHVPRVFQLFLGRPHYQIYFRQTESMHDYRSLFTHGPNIWLPRRIIKGTLCSESTDIID